MSGRHERTKWTQWSPRVRGPPQFAATRNQAATMISGPPKVEVFTSLLEERRAFIDGVEADVTCLGVALVWRRMASSGAAVANAMATRRLH